MCFVVAVCVSAFNNSHALCFTKLYISAYNADSVCLSLFVTTTAKKKHTQTGALQTDIGQFKQIFGI